MKATKIHKYRTTARFPSLLSAILNGMVPGKTSKWRDGREKRALTRRITGHVFCCEVFPSQSRLMALRLYTPSASLLLFVFKSPNRQRLSQSEVAPFQVDFASHKGCSTCWEMADRIVIVDAAVGDHPLDPPGHLLKLHSHRTKNRDLTVVILEAVVTALELIVRWQKPLRHGLHRTIDQRETFVSWTNE